MAKSRRSSSTKHSKESSTSRNGRQQLQREEKPHSWAVVRSLFTCKHLQAARLEQQMLDGNDKADNNNSSSNNNNNNNNNDDKKCKKMKYSCSGSNICSNTKVMQRPEASPSPPKTSSKSTRVTLNELNANGGNKAVISTSSLSSSSSSFSLQSATNSSSNSSAASRGIMPFRKLSGCYECRMVIDPALRDPSLRSTIFSCPECGEIFMKPDHLELHLSVRHAVSELGPEDTSRNIVEIIFQSSWLNKKIPVCKIERILKVRNTARTISRFEEYRDAIKAKATTLPKKQPRCIADGNELLRFYCSTFMCSLGLNGSSNLCTVPDCNVCTIIKNGFKVATTDGAACTKKGILTTATSGKAHDNTGVVSHDHEKRAMLVCRVIAGRVKKSMEGTLEGYDSIAGAAGVYSNLDELYVFNPKAILPCFVVIYKGF